MSIEKAYLELLKVSYGDLFRSLNQDIYGRLRDVIAFNSGQDAETVQNHYEALARPELFEAMGLSLPNEYSGEKK